MTRPVSRRSLAGAAALLTTAGGAAASSGADAVLLARVEDFVSQLARDRAELASWSAEDQAFAHAYGRKLARNGVLTKTDKMAAAIAKLPARTPEGLRAKARAAAWNAGGDDTALPRLLIADDLLGSLLADLTGLPAGKGAWA